MPKVKKAPPIDYDALFKEFISGFFPDFVAFANLILFEAIDRSEYKKQLFQYIKESGIPLGKMIKLFIFVRDFVHLPEPLELDFLNLQKSLNFSIEYTMQFSEGTKQMAIEIFERTH